MTIIRLQKQGVREYLEQGLPLLDAMISAEEYTEYILDRRLGCRQLGMNLPLRVTAKKISEHYAPGRRARGTPSGRRTSSGSTSGGSPRTSLPRPCSSHRSSPLRCARLLGQAAAPNIVVGRCDRTGSPLFDDGDEVLIMDPEGMPQDIVVADHTGTFNDYSCPLSELTVKYALPVTRRAYLPDPAAFAHAYLAAFEERLRRIQEDYRRSRKAFDSLFLHLPAQEPGSFAYRWKRVLARLDETNPHAGPSGERRNRT